MTAVARVREDDAIFEAMGGNAAGKQLPEVPRNEGLGEAEGPLEPRIGAAVLARVGTERYDLWFDRKTRLVVGGNTLFVEVGNGFAANWIRGKFARDLHAAAQEVLGHDVELCVRIAEDLLHTAALPDSAGAPFRPAPPHLAMPLGGCGATSSPTPANQPVINPRHTLEEFVVGPSNQMAYHASMQVAASPGKQFNPLFIHGHCGLGKTHLLQGICQRFAKLHPGKKWLYLTGEQFTNEFVEAIRTHRTEAFRRRIRGADLLVIDDVHFLGNKKATQEEFLHTFNQIEAGGHQVVLASDCAPRQIRSLSEQLCSRFVSGMVLRVDSPDLPTRLEILRRRVARYGWSVPDSVLMHIAQSATSSVRELEGLLLQAIAGIRLIDSGNPAGAAEVLAGLRERTALHGPVSPERIVQAVAGHFSLEISAVMGSGREKIVSIARAIAMHLIRQHTGMSYPEIGRAMGNKNHSTVIAACQRVEGLISSGELVCWSAAAVAGVDASPTGPAIMRHQAISDVLHDLEAAIRRAR